MKKRNFIFCVVMFLQSCATHHQVSKGEENEQSSEIYVLPEKVSAILSSKLSSYNKDSVYFSLSTIADEHFLISLNRMYFGGIYSVVRNSRKEIYLNSNFYPLIFEYDYSFKYIGSKKSYSKSLADSTIHIIQRPFLISHEGYFIEFSKDSVYRIFEK